MSLTQTNAERHTCARCLLRRRRRDDELLKGKEEEEVQVSGGHRPPFSFSFSFPLPKRRAHTRTHARKRTRSIPTSRLTDWIRKKRKKKKTLPGIVQAARVRSNRRLVFFFFFYFLFHFLERSRKKQLTRNNQIISSPLQPKNDSNGWCIAAICFVFPHFPWWNINAKRNLLRRPKKKQTFHQTIHNKRKSGFGLSTLEFVQIISRCPVVVVFSHIKGEWKSLSFNGLFFPADWDKVTSKVIKAERFPFHYSVPLPPSFPIGLGSLDGSFFLKNSTNTSTGCCRRRKRISSGSNNKRGGNAALSRRAPDFDKQRQVSRFLCLPFFC